MLFLLGDTPVHPAPVRYGLQCPIQPFAVGLPAYYPVPFSRFRPAVFESEKGKASVPFMTVSSFHELS
jgi:hypothetical protein